MGNDDAGGEQTMSTTVNAASIASRLLLAAEHDGQSLTNLQLQKLVFLVQSKELAERQVPAFKEPVQAWKNGPAIKPLYGMYKQYVDQPIAQVDASPISVEPLPDETIDAIEDVWTLFGGMTGVALWKLTHETGRVWGRHFRAGQRNIELPSAEIAEDWPAYRRVGEGRRASQHRAAKRAAAENPSLGSAQFAHASDPDYEAAKTRFRASRPQRRVG